MQTFDQAIELWHDFYLMVGTSAATLIGLLFVGLSINMDIIRREENVGFSALASQSFINFLFMLFIAITFLVPDQGPLGLGLPLLWMGGFGVWTNARLLATTLRGRKSKLTTGLIFWRFVLPLAAFLGMIVIAVSILQGTVSLI